MKIKKIISGLAAALIISSLSTINYEVKADDTTNEYHYISKQNNEEQLISYIKEQHRLLNQFVIDNVNSFTQLNANPTIKQLNRAITLFKQKDEQLFNQVKASHLSPSNYNAIVNQRNVINQTVQNLIDQNHNKLQASQNKAAQLVGQRNQVVNKIQAILATVNYNSVNSIQEAENLFHSLRNQIEPLVAEVNNYKAAMATLQQEVDALSTAAIETETSKLATLKVSENTSVPANKVEEKTTQSEASGNKQEVTKSEEKQATSDAKASQPESANIADYDSLKEVLRNNISNQVPHISVQMEFKTQEQVDEYQKNLGSIIREIGDTLGTATEFNAKSNISTYTLGGQIQRIIVKSDITITYTLKGDMVGLHKEYKQFVDSFVKENITNKNITSDYEKAKVIHDHLVNNYTYATEELATTRETASGISIHAPEALYKDKRGVCQAFAVMFKDMAAAAGLSVWYVTGQAGGGNHAWNIVTINGVKYYVDTTWDNNIKSNKYFLVGKTIMDADHLLDSQYNALAKDIPADRHQGA
ncbi:transglutaminase domain-containing protein [Streptococcus agalactiae]|uniref:transglutaminase domain-containing protein n=1 Tax=Streptococcus agalactiae TaxID=1311 RepID=UPI0002FDBCAE|nr:transglutaminase domain-containing protein [Streptococcus agalactiae]